MLLETYLRRTHRRVAMGCFAWAALALGSVQYGSAATFEEVSPPVGVNVPFVWRADTTKLPKCLWTYKRLPQEFSAAAISNGVVLASFEKKGFPRPSKEDVVLWADHHEVEPRPPCFWFSSKYGQMSFTLGDRAPDSPQDIARDEAAVRRALDCAALLGVDRADLAATNSVSSGVSGVFLARQVDGIPFTANAEGLHMQFGRDGKVRGFVLLWPRLEREGCCATASTREIEKCIRARKAPVIPENEERNYFDRVRRLGNAGRVTIRRIEPYYMEGDYGEELPADGLPTRVVPVAEIEADFDIGTNRISARLFVPIIETEARRVLGRLRAAEK